MKRLLIGCCLITLFLFLLSCSSGNKDVSIYAITNTDFENSLLIDGVVEPVRAVSTNCPLYIEGVVAYLVEDGTYVKEGDLICIIEVQELQLQYDQLLVALENSEAGLNKTKADLNMQYALLEAQVLTNEADTEIALLDSLQLKYSTPNQIKIKKLNLERVTIEKERYEKKMHALSIIQQSEIRKLELEKQRLANRVQTVKERLDALEIKAPKDGLAIRARNPLTGTKLQVGDPVWSNMPLVNLPDFSEMKVKIQAPEADYKLINLNDSVVFTFDAMPDNLAWGKIIMKSPVGQQMKQGSKVKFFEIEASVDSTLTMPEPGFTANCRIIMQQVADTIVVPQIAVFEDDSIKVVYVKNKNAFEKRQVLTGIYSPKEVIISAGLKIDEQIALAKPPLSSVKKTVLLPDPDPSEDETENETDNSENEENDNIPSLQGAPSEAIQEE